MSTLSENHKTPGHLIQDLLADRGWTQSVLSIVLGIDKTAISKILAAKRPVDASLALALGDVFGVDPKQFLDIQQTLDLAEARLKERPDPQRATRAQMFGDLPIAEMIKRGWLNVDSTRDIPALERALISFFQSDSVDSVFHHAAKKTDAASDVTLVQLAWLHRVQKIAREMLVGKFSNESLEAAIGKLSRLLSAPSEIRHVPRILAEAGVRYLIVESLPGAKIDGVCFWLNDSSPVIAMSLRHDRIDNFWFVLRHEIEHVKRGHGRVAAILDSELEGDRAGTGESISEEERVANQAAAEFCVPAKQIKAFVERKAPFFAERDLIGFARTIQVHPGLIAGQLQHMTKSYNRFRNHLVKIREVATTPGTMVDGWGTVAPVEE